ncbi:EVE domain-containing protein [Portibacter lacus]|uniref:AAA+ ATPase domain-containing protein n=1 Tax=Portibacter lacus TaxID=1099794 RepID=A0AA37WEE0_9BACT|nr:EVE domain-containing protein [Portibacter lacus]GLR16005.1 hypothetical protein GCM10007940_06200 [Portibacter lacus]
MKDKIFSWVETHKKLTQFISTKENAQQDLIDLLKSVGIGPFNDKAGPGEHNIDLDEIDPFTFFCYIYKYGTKKRLKYLQEIAAKLNIEQPLGESGIPSAQAQKVWLFSYKYDRNNNEISRLWSLFNKELKDQITDQDFEDALQIRSTGKTKLTEALFYVNPEKYLPINGPTKPYLKEYLQIDPKFNSYTEYLDILAKVKDKIDIPFYELSYEALKWNNERKKVNYWIFQGNPNVFDFETALRDEILSDWTVSAHKGKIKTGDKVIIWITGEQSGCYGFAEVVSEPYEKTSSADDHSWKVEDKSALKADIKITHNIVDSPILKSIVDSREELKDLKVGNQGTNFSATEDEFESLLGLAIHKTKKQYWLYAPGENARNWEEFYENGIIGLGWDGIGDLKQYDTRDEIKKALVNAYGGKGSKKNAVLANDDFLNKIKIGDVIIAKKGRSELLGYGVVASNYKYDKNRTEYQKVRLVDWKQKGNWKLDFRLVLKTLTDITKYPSELKEYSTYYEQLLGIMELNNDLEKIDPMNFPLNTILYGPPGTGKTYHTILRAAEIIENRKIESYDEALEIFKTNLHDQIEFITFHQNYSYEDFIQGLRPETDNKSSLVFDKKDGVFLKIATDALFEYYKKSKSKEESISNSEIDLNEAYLDFIENLKSSDKKDFKTSSGSTIHISGYTKNDNIEFKHSNSARNYIVSTNRLLKLYNVYSDIESIKNVHNDIREAIGGCNTTVYWVALNEFISFIKSTSNKSNIDEPDNEKYDEIGYESKKKLLTTIDLDTLRKVNSNEVKKYVIIIDEINRANISRVFGELITLIEPDKRSHGTIPLEARLPSGDPFIVPSNLFIIGTMNTADKSIALLDIALRRRFEFESMYPKYEIEGQEIYDVNILKKINKEIIKSKGHDFQIGHAYFMGENKDLVHRMNKKVIPLLLEYYMNDEKEVKKILHTAGLTIEEDSWPLRITGTND